MSWRDTTCGDAARRRCRPPRHPRRLGRHAPRPRRARVRRPARLLREDPARHQPRARRRGGRDRARDPERVRPPGRGRDRRRARRRRQPEPPDRRDRGAASTRSRIVSRSEPLPFQLDEEGVDENLRLRYRWLDLRTERMQRNLRLSHRVIVGSIRRTMDELGFVDVWTPSMTKGTPEGARDFLVPVRLQPGPLLRARAVAAAVQAALQIGGLDRYYQIATCWRDEDLRADRQFEFRQLDIEMSFVEREDVLDVLEEAVVASFEALGREPPAAAVPAPLVARGRAALSAPTSRTSASGSRSRTRRRSPAARSSACSRTRLPSASSSPRARSRAPSSRGSRRSRRSGGRRASRISSATSPARCGRRSRSSSRSRSSPRSRAEPGSTVLFAADEPATVSRVLGGLRTHLGRELELADTSRNEFLWILDFPLFEFDDDTGRWTFVHHPFTGREAGPGAPRRGRSGRVHQRGATTSCGTASSSAPGRSGSTTRSSSAPSSARWGWARRRRRRSSASSSRRCRWARRRTAASPWASSGSSCSWPASRTSAR